LGGCEHSLFQAQPQEHMSLTKHLTAELKAEEFVAGKGVVVKWERVRRENHWFDALYNCCAAAHGCGVRLVQEQVNEQQRPAPARRDQDLWIDPAKYLNTQTERFTHSLNLGA
jgi:hypothetical protein